MKYIKCLEIGILDSKILLKRLKIFFFKRIKKINILKPNKSFLRPLYTSLYPFILLYNPNYTPLYSFILLYNPL